jgi:hypothetical protein
MTNDLREAIREYDHAVDAEAARLVRLGVPPIDAVIQARQRIRQQSKFGPLLAEQQPSTAQEQEKTK